MSSSLPYQVLYQNQLQFNLGVPLATQNLVASYHHPSPIIVERVGGQHAIPSKIVTQKLQGSPEPTDRSAVNYSTLSEDQMEVLSQLARRDLKNRALQAQTASNNTSAATPPLRGKLQQYPTGKAQGIRSSRLNPQPRRSRAPLTVKETEKNRRFGAVQTPPPQRPVSHTRLAQDSSPYQRNATADTTQESDIFFPVKPTLPSEAHNLDEIAKLQQEMEGYLHFVGKIVNRAIDERSTDFLRPAMRGKQRDGYLIQEEGYDRARARVGEQNTRSVRNLYNLRQKVKQLQRDTAQADFNKPAKKSQLSAQLVVIYRGVTKSVQTFVNQLPYQDLATGLPSHFYELALLLRQLTGLVSLTRSGSQAGTGEGELLALLETVEALNAKWSVQQRGQGPKPVEKKEKKSAVAKGWVSDTKVDKDIFLTKDKPSSVITLNQTHKKALSGAVKKQQPTKQTRSRPQVRMPAGKENRRGFTYRGRRDELRSGIAALLNQHETRDELSGNGGPPRPVAWEVDISRKHQKQDPRKGYLLPSDLLEKRERAQRAVELSNQRDWNFAEATASSRLKTSLRPSSAPPSPDKHVNFDLDKKSPVPWIPSGSSASCSPHSTRSRSASLEQRSPFYVRDLDGRDVRNIFQEQQKTKKSQRTDSEIPQFGYQSLPTDKKLRSADVSNSFIDEVEHRLLARMMGQQMRGDNRVRQSHTIEDRSSGRLDGTADTTGDLYSELGDDTLNTTSPEDLVTREAVSLMDAPTLENVKLRLRQMQHEQKEIRQRWSSLKFYDFNSKSKIFSASEIQSHWPRDPPALELGRPVKTSQREPTNLPVNKEVVEVPLIFTKPVGSSSRPIHYLHTVYQGGAGDRDEGDCPLTMASLQQPQKRLLTLKQTTAERIAADRSRFESYLKRQSYHPSGKFDPWALVDEVSDEILMDCLMEISEEVEGINEEIANFMYKSEFMVEQTQSPASEAVYEVANEAPRPQPRSPKLSPQGFAGEGDRLTQHPGTLRPVMHRNIRGKSATEFAAQGDHGDLHLSLSNDHLIISERGSPVERPLVTPRSPGGALRASQTSPLGLQRSMTSPPSVKAKSPPSHGGGIGTGSSHLWRNSPVSPTGSVNQVFGSQSPTPRSPHVSSPGEGGRYTPRGGAGQRSPLRGRRSPMREGRKSLQVSASEPLLDDVSHLLHNKESSEEEEASLRSHEEVGDDDDEENYSNEDFEDVTDVEL